MGASAAFKFLFVLSLALGVKHPNRLNLTGAELADWMAFFEASPFGDIREDLRLAQMLKHASGESVNPFYPYELPEPLTDEEAEAAWRALEGQIEWPMPN